MSYIKNFLEFIKEGAIYSDDKNSAIISFKPHKEGANIIDVLDVAHGKSVKVSNKRFTVFYALESPKTSGSSDSNNKEVKNLMDLIKSGKITIEGHGSQSKALFNFMKNNIGTDINNVKYIVMAESQDSLVGMMAEALKENLKNAEIIYLKKVEYESATSAIKDKYRREFTEDKEQLVKQIDDMLAAEGHVDNKKRSRNQLLSLFKAFDELKSENPEKKFKINTTWNHIRQFLNTKYNYNEKFIEALQKCFLKSNDSKMIIIDDNLFSGTDIREIFEVVEHYFNIQNEAVTEMIKKEDKSVHHRLSSALTPIKDNIFGFVMYRIKGKQPDETKTVKKIKPIKPLNPNATIRDVKGTWSVK